MTRLSSILTPPTFARPFGVRGLREATRYFNTIEFLAEGKRYPLEETVILPGVELQIQRLVACCAHRVYVPANVHSARPLASYLKRNVTPTLRRVLVFADRRDTIWRSIEAYVLPIHSDMQGRHVDDDVSFAFSQMFWDVYLLALGARIGSQLFVDPVHTAFLLEKVSSYRHLSPESRARLARLRGLFALFEKPTDVPGFICRSLPGTSFHERVQEILDDAYLLEASALRRVFGLGSNLASIRRDLRHLLKFIATHRRWAKGLVRVTSQHILIPSSVSGAVDAISEILSGASPDLSAPVLLDPNARLVGPDVVLMEAFRAPFTTKPVGMVSHRLLGSPKSTKDRELGSDREADQDTSNG